MTFSIALASSLQPDGGKEGAGGWRADMEGGLADDWEYVMYGKVSWHVFIKKELGDESIEDGRSRAREKR